MKNYFLLITAVVLLALDFSVTKKYQQKYGASRENGLKFNIFSGLFSALVFFGVNSFKFECSALSIALAFLSSALCAGYIIIGFYIMKIEKLALYTVFLMTGGMIVPYVWGLIFLDEEISLKRTAGLIIIAAAVVLLNVGRERPRIKSILLCIVVFFLNGFVSVVSKEHQLSSNAVSSPMFVMLSGLSKSVICSLVLLIYKFKNKSSASDGRTDIQSDAGEKFNPEALILIGVSALISGFSYLLQLISARTLPATVLYPVITGGSIIFTALAGRLFFKEKITKKIAFSAALCLAGTCMFL